MPQAIEQPARDPVNRLPPYLRPNISDDAQRTLDTIDRRQGSPIPATAITRIDVPFEDVLTLALKLVVAQIIVGAIIGVPVALLVWYAFLR